MQISKSFSFIAVVMLVAVVFGGLTTIPAAAQIDTMQFRYNAAHTGDYSPVAGSVPSNGQLKWSYATGGPVRSSPAVANGIVYIGSNDQYLYALDATTGAFKWKYSCSDETGAASISSPAVANGVVYVGSSDRNLYALDAATGAFKWSYGGTLNGGDPAVANGIVYGGSNEQNVYALDAATGAKLWIYTTGGAVWSSPAVVNGVVYVGSDDGYVYAIGTQSTQPPNQAPTANAGTDQTAIVRNTVTLDGLGSSDPDGNQLTYSWTIVSKPTSSTATLANPTSAQPTLIPDRMGTYVLQLIVNDGKVNSAPDTVTVTVKPTKASVQQDLATLKTTVNNLPNSAFYPGTKSALLAVLNAAELQLRYNKYDGAAYTLSKFLVRTDGCALRGTPDTSDLVRTCAAQAQLYPQVLNLIQELKAL